MTSPVEKKLLGAAWDEMHEQPKRICQAAAFATAEDWRRFMDEAPRLMDVLDRYETMGRRAKYKPMGKRKRKSAAGLKVKR